MTVQISNANGIVTITCDPADVANLPEDKFAEQTEINKFAPDGGAKVIYSGPASAFQAAGFSVATPQTIQTALTNRARSFSPDASAYTCAPKQETPDVIECNAPAKDSSAYGDVADTTTGTGTRESLWGVMGEADPTVGASVRDFDNGTREITLYNGRVFRYPDTAVVEHLSGGGVRVTNGDQVVEHELDADAVRTKDGARVETYTDGTKIQMNPDGSTFIQYPQSDGQDNPQAPKQVFRDGRGTETTVRFNGSRDIVFPDKTTLTIAANGARSFTDATGANVEGDAVPLMVQVGKQAPTDQQKALKTEIGARVPDFNYLPPADQDRIVRGVIQNAQALHDNGNTSGPLIRVDFKAVRDAVEAAKRNPTTSSSASASSDQPAVSSVTKEQVGQELDKQDWANDLSSTGRDQLIQALMGVLGKPGNSLDKINWDSIKGYAQKNKWFTATASPPPPPSRPAGGGGGGARPAGNSSYAARVTGRY